MKVNIIYIRHGFSCANSVQYLGGFFQQLHRLVMLDPELTHYAKQQITKHRDQLKQSLHVDIVCSSTMIRAIQTAAYLFPKRKISILPYIKEKGRTAGNIPAPWKEQMKKLTKSQRELLNPEWSQHQGRAVTDHQSFMTWLAQHLPDLLQHHHVSKHRKEVTIAIVMHSRYMQKSLTKGILPKNVQGFLFHYEWDADQRRLEHERMVGAVLNGFETPDKETFRKAKGDRNCPTHV